MALLRSSPFQYYSQIKPYSHLSNSLSFPLRIRIRLCLIIPPQTQIIRITASDAAASEDHALPSSNDDLESISAARGADSESDREESEDAVVDNDEEDFATKPDQDSSIRTFTAARLDPSSRANGSSRNAKIKTKISTMKIEAGVSSISGNLGYQNQPEHEAFAQLLEAPQEDAQMIIRECFPVPRLVVCDQHGSQARFLLAKLNLSATYNNPSEMNAGSDVIFTDDVSLQVFFQHLQKLAVQS